MTRHPHMTRPHLQAHGKTPLKVHDKTTLHEAHDKTHLKAHDRTHLLQEKTPHLEARDTITFLSYLQNKSHMTLSFPVHDTPPPAGTYLVLF